MQIKMTVRCFHIPIGMAKTQNTDNTNAGEGCGTTGTLLHCWEYKMVQPLWKAD